MFGGIILAVDEHAQTCINDILEQITGVHALSMSAEGDSGPFTVRYPPREMRIVTAVPDAYTRGIIPHPFVLALTVETPSKSAPEVIRILADNGYAAVSHNRPLLNLPDDFVVAVVPDQGEEDVFPFAIMLWPKE